MNWMISILGLSFFAGITMVLWGFVSAPAATRKSEFTEHVTEGIDGFSKRFKSLILQLIIYLSALFVGFSYLTRRQFLGWEDVLGFALGGITMSVFAFGVMKMVPLLVPILMQRAKGFYSDPLSVLFIFCQGIGVLVVSGVMVVFVLLMKTVSISSLVAFGMGVMLVAFFMRIGGGVYRVSAKINRHMITANASDLPDDYRNPARVLNIISGYIGDMMSFSSDILSSYVLTLIAALISAAAMNQTAELGSFPLMVICAAMVVSLIAIGIGGIRLRYRAQNILLEVIYLTVVGGVAAIYGMTKLIHLSVPQSIIWAYLCGVIGSVVIAYTADYFSSHLSKPVQKVAEYSEQTPVLGMIYGFSGGLMSNGIYLLVMVLVSVISYGLGGAYGTAIASLGMVSVTPMFIASKVFRSLSTDAVMVAELQSQDTHVKTNLNRMNTLGQTTGALGNGFSAACAMMATLSLFLSQMGLIPIPLLGSASLLSGIIGFVLGLTVMVWFLAGILRGTVVSILEANKEVRRQFRDIPYLIEGKARPDVVKAANYHALYALKALTVPGVVFVLASLGIGGLLGVGGLLGYVFGIVVVGLSQGFSWANFGDSLAGASLYVENGHLGGPESGRFQHLQTGKYYSTVFNELLGPCSNILLKSVAIMSLLLLFLML